ncbi:MAG: hypothetical protein ACXVCT_22180, partial [Ktedonobacterales bacterium]
MPGNSGQRRRERGSRAKALVLLVASLWLLILFTCVANPWLTSAVSAQSRSLLSPTNTPTLPIPTVTIVPPTATLPG